MECVSLTPDLDESGELLVGEEEEEEEEDALVMLDPQFSHEPTFNSDIEEIGGVEVEVVGANKIYTTNKTAFHAVRDANLKLKPGSITALLGPSGSGKTTLMRMIAGLETMTSGRVYFDGVDYTDLPIQERQVGFVFQSYALFSHMNVEENIAFGPRIRKLEMDTDARVKELLKLIQLEHIAKRLPNQLSGGQRQRVALARALACRPRLLLLDEPLGALDPVVRSELRKDLRELILKLGVTCLLVTHDQEEANEMADEIACFNRGRIEQVGKPTDLYLYPKTPFVMNFIGGNVAKFPSSSLIVKQSGTRTNKKLCLIRTDDIIIHRRNPRLKQKEQKLLQCIQTTKGTCMDIMFLGDGYRYVIECEDGIIFSYEVTRLQYDAKALDIGQTVYAQVRPLDFVPCDVEEIAAQAKLADDIMFNVTMESP